jgi:hypothetical protein
MCWYNVLPLSTIHLRCTGDCTDYKIARESEDATIGYLKRFMLQGATGGARVGCVRDVLEYNTY